MKATELLRFVLTNNLEYSKIVHSDGNEDIILFINNYLLDEWNILLGKGITFDEGVDCVMMDGYFCFHMGDICDYCGIDIKEIFEFKEN